MLAAPKSGSGKTTVACALLQALKDMGYPVVSYKCGPDYIDPMFHKTVLGVPSKNLDTFFTGEEDTKALFLAGRTEEDFVVMEGAMGLFDGLGGIREEGSSYHLAKVTRTPVILVVDAKGMGRSILAVIAGFLAYDTEHLIRGVILNRVSKSYYEMLRPLIEEELKIPAVGYFAENPAFRIESRHLGLKMPEEYAGIREQIRAAAEALKETVSMEQVIEIAESGERMVPADDPGNDVLHCPENRIFYRPENSGGNEVYVGGGPVIAVAKDEAFCFYYEDNLRLLEEAGAELVYFSPVHDKELPAGCSGILLGGGYPELYAEELSANKAMRLSIKTSAEKGMPMVAECGGFMYLHETVKDKAGISHEMAGVIPGTCHDSGKLVRFGYIELEETGSHFLPAGGKIRGHEFHYYDSTNNGADCTAVKPVTGRTYPCIISGETYWLGFPHLYYPSNPAFAEHFVKLAADYRKRSCNPSVPGL